MLTRQFVLLLTVFALIAVGVGLVVGSRSSREVALVTNPSEANTIVAPKPAPAVHDENAAEPGAKAISLWQPKVLDVASSTGEANKVAATAEDGSSASPRAKTSLTPEPTAPANEGANGDSESTAATSPAKSASAESVAGDSEYVFVTRASLLQAHLAADEAAAVATLRSVSSAQAQLQSSGAIDTDGDGSGEYGYFAELAGAVPVRVAADDKPAKLEPAVLSKAFAQLTANGNVPRSGYLFRMYLPGSTVAGKMPGVAEGSRGGWNPKGPPTDPDNCEIRWCCYAWPIEVGNSGTRAFCMDQEGDMLVLANADGAYSGDDHAPAFDAAGTRPGDMLETPIPGAKHCDGRAWSEYTSDDVETPSFVELGPATAADAEVYNRPDSKADKVVLPRALIVQIAVSTGEGHAIANLRMISSAQEKAEAAGVIDTDQDGKGEYGFFGELAGSAPFRAPARDKRIVMHPPVLTSSWGKVTSAGNVVIDGYVYRMYLPGPLVQRKSPGISESPGGGCAATGLQPDHNGAELLWTVYAWPLEAGKTGQRAFFMNQEGDMLMLANKDGGYSGEAHAPTFDAALGAGRPGDMCASTAINVKSVDGRGWAPIH
jgi:hypothetical protein